MASWKNANSMRRLNEDEIEAKLTSPLVPLPTSGTAASLQSDQRHPQGSSPSHLSRSRMVKSTMSSEDDFDVPPPPKRGMQTTGVSTFGMCHLPLTATVIINIALTFSLVAILCFLPIDSLNSRVMEKLASSQSSALASLFVEAINQNFYMLIITLYEFSANLMVGSTQQWNWTAADMPQFMSKMCHQLVACGDSLGIMYLAYTSPAGGYSAYCSTQYVSYPLVGNYIINNESSYRYVVDDTTFEYVEPRVVYEAVKPMTPSEYAVDFGAPNNPWYGIVLPVMAAARSSKWLFFRIGERGVLTYNLLFNDAADNDVVFTGAIQPIAIHGVFANRLLPKSIGMSVVFDTVTHIVLDCSLQTPEVTRMDNWNYDYADIDTEVPPLLYVDNISNDLFQAAYREVFHYETDVRWAAPFSYKNRRALAVMTPLNMGYTEPTNLVNLYVTAESLYAPNMKLTRIVVISVITFILLLLAFADVVLLYLFLQPLHELKVNSGGSSNDAQPLSNISELAAMQQHFYNLNLQLKRMKSFLPHTVLGAQPVEDSSSRGESLGEDPDEPTNQFAGNNDVIDLNLNERALTDQVNHYRRKYCTIIVFSIHICESENNTALLESVSTAFLEAVISTVVHHGGVIELQRPDTLYATFGAQRYMTMHQQRALKCALQVRQNVVNSFIAPRFVCLVDSDDCYVGTCGAADRFARVTYKLALISRRDVITLCKCCTSQILVTQRLAVTMDENTLLMPVETVKLPLDPKPVTFYELRGDARRIEDKTEVEKTRYTISVARIAFEHMSQADYQGALKVLRPYETSDHQLARLAETCRSRIEKNDTRPYFKVLEHMRFEIPDYGSNPNSKLRKTSMVAPLQFPNTVADYDLSFFTTVPASRTVDLNKVSSPTDPEEFGGLFDVIVETEPDDDVASVAMSSYHGSTAGYASECVVAGEIPTKFFDAEGTEWVRSNDRLGSGAYADVYRGLSSTGILSALKCIQLRSKNADLTSISEELRVFSSLDHENIVQYLSVFISDSYLIQIMEFVPGGALDCLTKSFGPLLPGAACRFVRDILCGLSYLHSMGIVHCDIKPHNVLLAMDGQCKLSDFGSALMRATGELEDDFLELRGTPGYMAPEVANGALPTPKSDVFSLGVTILELLLGRLPWEYVTEEEEKPTEKPALSEVQSSPLMMDLAELSHNSPELNNEPLSRLPIEKLLRNRNEFVRQICKGNIAPRIPPTLTGDVVSFIEQCIDANPEKRATPEALLRHRWLM